MIIIFLPSFSHILQQLLKGALLDILAFLDILLHLCNGSSSVVVMPSIRLVLVPIELPFIFILEFGPSTSRC